MKIEKIILNNFRNYRKKHSIFLNEKVTILYGENGNGKSSFFDAIEWCLTGKIARFPDYADLKRALANKEMIVDDECYVELHFLDLFIKRTFSKREADFGKQDIILYRKTKHKNDLKEIKIASGENKVNQFLKQQMNKQGIVVDNRYTFGEMLDKAYVLSQDQINNFVTRDKPEEKYLALSSIMGFEQVVNLMKNIKVTVDVFENELENLGDNVSKINGEIKTYEKQKKIVDFDLITNFEKTINAPSLNFNIIEKKRLEVMKNIENLQEIKMKIQSSNFKDSFSINESLENYDKDIKKIEKDLDILKFEEKQLNMEILRTEENLKIIKGNAEKKANFEKKLAKLNDLKSTLNRKNTKIELIEEIFIVEENLKSIKFASENKEKFSNSKVYLENIDQILTDLYKKYNNQEFTLNEVKLAENNLTEEMLNSDKNSATQILLEALNNISAYMKIETNNPDVCPVCSNETIDNLSIRLDANIAELIQQINQSKAELGALLSKKKSLANQKSNLQKILGDIKNEILEKETKKKNNQITIESIQGDNLFKTELFDLNLDYNLAELYNLELENRNKLEIDVEVLKEIEKLETNLSKFNNNVSYDDSEISIDAMENKLKLKKQKLEDVRINLNEETSKFKLLTNQFNKLKQIHSAVFEINSHFVDIEIQTLQSNLKEAIDNKEKKLPLFDQLVQQQNYLEENNIIDKSIISLKNRRLNYENNIFGSENYLKELKLIYSKMNEKYGGEALSFLNSPSSSIKRYYGFLNPNPSEYHDIYFDVQDGNKLYINVQQGEAQEDYVDVTTVLSSGQLNVLAIAIFLATNESQTFSYFDFAAIDDPIQNMDDVNKFSICDVLSNLDRQLIFSTHDQDFLNLFLKKNENNLETINLYNLESSKNIYEQVNLVYPDSNIIINS